MRANSPSGAKTHEAIEIERPQSVRCGKSYAQTNLHIRRSEIMTLERVARIFLCIVITSAVATGQQKSETTNQGPQGPARNVIERTYTASDLASWRRVQTRSESGGREVVVEISEAPDVEGRWAPIQEIVMETIRVAPNTAQTRRDVFEFSAGRRGRLLERTESLQETLANGDTSTVYNTWAPDLNGRLSLTSRRTEQTRSTAPDVRQTDTAFMVPDVNEKLRETERTEYTERRINPGVVRRDSTHLVRDVNGQWQPMETRHGEAREIGAAERMEEQTIQRPDINGKLAVNERSVTRRFKANEQDHVVIETYASYADRLPRSDSRLALSQRVNRTTTATADGVRYTVEEVEGRSPVSPNDAMQVLRRTVTTVRQIGPDRWVTEQQEFERDVNGRLQLVNQSH
jgi:hypothetical protein